MAIKQLYLFVCDLLYFDVCELQWDFTVLSGGLLVLLIVLIVFGLLCAIFHSRVSENVLHDLFEVVAIVIFLVICISLLSVYFSLLCA